MIFIIILNHTPFENIPNTKKIISTSYIIEIIKNNISTLSPIRILQIKRIIGAKGRIHIRKYMNWRSFGLRIDSLIYIYIRSKNCNVRRSKRIQLKFC